MKTLKLTVQSCGNGIFRLGVNTSDSLEIFKCRNKIVKLIIDVQEILVKTSCGTPCLGEIPISDKKYKKGYDLYHKDLDKWIKENHFNDFKTGKPTRLLFELIESDEPFVLRYLEKLEL